MDSFDTPFLGLAVVPFVILGAAATGVDATVILTAGFISVFEDDAATLAAHELLIFGSGCC